MVKPSCLKIEKNILRIQIFFSDVLILEINTTLYPPSHFYWETFHFILLLLVVVLGIDLRVLYMLDKCSAAELHSSFKDLNPTSIPWGASLLWVLGVCCCVCCMCGTYVEKHKYLLFSSILAPQLEGTHSADKSVP